MSLEPLGEFPDPNLDRTSRGWTRFVETVLKALWKHAQRQEKTDLNVNKTQNSNADTLAGQVSDIADVVARMQETVAYLLGQTVVAFNRNAFSNISTASVFAYDPSWDAAVVIDAGSTGKLMALITAGCQGSGITKGPVVGIEASWSGGSYAFANDQSYDATSWKYTGTVARAYEITCPPFATVTVRTRRGATTNNNEQILVFGVSLQVTKLGM